jgi:hypothetical protein
MEKTQQYYIDEFYKFLESKEQGLSERFNGCFIRTDYANLQDYLEDTEVRDFICGAFLWSETDNRKFWSDLYDQWLLHLEQL